jgi:2-iminobutanoate/2-iminopropanoate deaminase
MGVVQIVQPTYDERQLWEVKRMERQRLMPKGHWGFRPTIAPAGTLFSHGWRIDNPGTIIYVGGQISTDENGNVVGKGDIEVQTRNVFESIRRVLREAGADMKDVVKYTTYFVYEGGTGEDATEYWEKMTKVRMEFFEEPGPSGAGVRVLGLAYPDLLIETEAIAVLP